MTFIGLSRPLRQHPAASGLLTPRASALLLSLWLALAAPLAGADTLDFQQCVALALRQNPGLAATQSQIAQAEAGLKQAQGSRSPKVTLSLNGTYTNDALSSFGLKLSQRGATFGDFGFADFLAASQAQMPTDAMLAIAPDRLNQPDAARNFNTRIEAQMPLYTGGLIEGYVKQAQSHVKAAQSGDLAARQQVTFHVLQAYEGTHSARAYVEVAKQSELAAQAYVKTIENLLKQGVVVKSDLLSAQIFLENVRVQAKQAQNAADAALDQLHLLLGLPLTAPLELGARVLPALLPGGTTELRQQALARHPGLNAMRGQLAGADAGVQVASAGYYPQVGLLLRQDWNDKNLALGAGAYTVGAQLSWNVFDAGVTKAAVGRAAGARAELAARLQEAEDGIGFQVGDALRRAGVAQQRVAVHALSVTQATEALNLVEKRYKNGVSTIVELLAARAQLDKAQADRVAAQYELAVQRAALKLAVGALDDELTSPSSAP